jgi:type III secretion protein Q
MKQPLALPRVTAAHVAQRNAIFRRRIAIRSHWMDRDWAWTWTLQPLAASRHHGAWIEAEWGDTRVWTSLPDGLLRHVAATLLRSGQVFDLPPALRLAVAEAAFAELSERVEALSRRRLRLLAIDAVDPDLSGKEGLAWEMRSGSEGHAGELWLDGAGIAQLAAALQRMASKRALRADLSMLPVSLRFYAGQTRVKLDALTRLAVRDVILFDESWIGRDGAVMLSPGGRTAYRARMRGTMMEVTEGPMQIMENAYDDEHQESTDPLEDLPIRISFDLGERSMPLHELQSLSPGYTFDLGRDLRQAVQVRANGMLIGEGELVDIDGRIGVVVNTLSPGLERLD